MLLKYKKNLYKDNNSDDFGINDERLLVKLENLYIDYKLRMQRIY